MAIPDRIRLPPVNKSLFDEMSELCDAIERELASGRKAEVLLQKWHSHAQRRYEPNDFRMYWQSISKETFVGNALNPAPCFDNDLVYAEALAVLDAVTKVAASESEVNYYVDWLESQFPGSSTSDLIYWPDEWFGDESLLRNEDGALKPESELSNDQILAYAMARSGRKLSGAPDNVVLPFPMPTGR